MRVIGMAEQYVKRNNITKGQIWCVYDKDSFPASDFNGVVRRAEQLNKVNQENGKIELDRKIKYIITFGYGNNIVSDIVDLNYGLEMASMMAKIDSINTQSSKFFSLNKSKSLIIYNNANFNTQVGEAVDYLTAEIEEYSHRSSVKNLLQLITSPHGKSFPRWNCTWTR